MRMVATDLDGTIVGPDLSVSGRTVAALRACEDAGVPVVLVTGRPPRWMSDVVARTGAMGQAICANGAVVYDCLTGGIVRVRTIPAASVAEVVDRLRHALGDVDVALETPQGFLREPGYQPRWDVDTNPRGCAPLKVLLQADPQVIKVLVRAEHSSGDAMLALARREVPDLVEATHSNAADCLLELSAPGVSKAATLAELAAERGVDALDVVAFGDQPNDVPMLVWAGRGYAMADGHPEALAASDAVAPPVTQDGVAQVLERLLLRRRESAV